VNRLALAVRSPIVRARVGRAEHRQPRRANALLRRVPAAAWVCALIALLNAATWSLIVPPFEGKDEADHFAYVEQIVENGSLPENGQPNGNYSKQEDLVLAGLHADEVIHSPQSTSISSEAEQRALIKDDHAGASLEGSGEAGIATSEPPLYYTIQALPYLLARGNILVQLQLMRLVGALFGALTALFTFLFLREILPRSPWAATVGALAVALQPLFGFMSGSVNPDSMLFAVSAVVFYCLARAFRRGLTRRLAVVLGIFIAVGFLTKLNFIGLAFGAYAGLAVLAVREARARGRVALRLPLLAAAIGVLPVGLYALRNALANHHTLGLASNGGSLLAPEELLHTLSYIWQFYLPRLPGMTHYFEGLMTYKDIWFDRSVGLYGWMDTMFPTWVDNVALLPAALVAVLFVREVILRRRALRRRLPEFGVYVAIVVGLLVLIGTSSYDSDALNHSPAFAEPRYLLPLLPLLGAVFTLAVRGAGRRWAPVAGAGLIVLVFGYDIVSQLQVIARYYG
jgi:4-amino-4-deoxy-L-arabinose transferase-like glycosyltransferase